MKNIILILWVLLTSLTCNKYLDINYNPSVPQRADEVTLLAPIFPNIALGIQFDARLLGRYIQFWGRTFAADTYEIHGYAPNSDLMGQQWRQHYWKLGKNIENIIAFSKESGLPEFEVVARACMLYSWQNLTDYHGELVLTQAFDDSRFVFDYDDQETIYNYIMSEGQAILDLAETITESSPKLAKVDMIYQGDIEKWKKFVYSVMARNRHHLTNKSSYNPDEVIDLVSKSFNSNADNATVKFEGNLNDDSNFFGPRRNNLTTYRHTDFIVGLMDGRVFNEVRDPRLQYVLTACADGEYRGVVATRGEQNSGNQVVPNVFGDGMTTNPGPGGGRYLFQDDAPFPIATYSEMKFIEAEAYLLKGDNTSSYRAMEEGIRAHMDFAQVPEQLQSDFLNSDFVDKENITTKDIMCQKMISLWGHNFNEAWVDLRRYQYDTTVFKGYYLPEPEQLYTDNNGKYVYRVRPRYNSEYVWNIEALEKIGGLEPDFHTKKMWFIEP